MNVYADMDRRIEDMFYITPEKTRQDCYPFHI